VFTLGHRVFPSVGGSALPEHAAESSQRPPSGSSRGTPSFPAPSSSLRAWLLRRSLIQRPRQRLPLSGQSGRGPWKKTCKGSELSPHPALSPESKGEGAERL
jgi:hypothetical protein